MRLPPGMGGGWIKDGARGWFSPVGVSTFCFLQCFDTVTLSDGCQEWHPASTPLIRKCCFRNKRRIKPTRNWLTQVHVEFWKMSAKTEVVGCYCKMFDRNRQKCSEMVGNWSLIIAVWNEECALGLTIHMVSVNYMHFFLQWNLLHFTWGTAEAKCILVMAVHVSVCLCVCPSPHSQMDPDVSWGNGTW